MRGRFLSFLLCNAVAEADFQYYTAQLDGHQIIPTATDVGLEPSSATGLMNLVVDDVTGRFRMEIILEGLVGNYNPCFQPQGICSGAHLHLGAVGQSGPAHIYNTRNDIWMNENGNNNPMAGDWSYSASGQIFITDLSTALSNLEATNVYLNIHTDYLTTGEIRGQVIPSTIPEPGSLALLSMGTVLVVFRLFSFHGRHLRLRSRRK